MVNEILKLALTTTLLSLTTSTLVPLKQWAQNTAHTDLTISVNIYNDNTKFVSGSNDYTVKIWSMKNFSLLHTETFGFVISHISLHPVDNRIFVLCYDGNLRVLQPNNYGVLFNAVFAWSGNFLSFFQNNAKFIVGGYDGVTNPVFHIFDTTTYAPVAGGPTTIFTTDKQITVTSVSKDGKLLAAISSQTAPPIQILLYNLTSKTLLKSYLDNTNRQNWITFSPFKNQFYVNANDKTIRCYKLNPFNNQYIVGYTFSTQDYGYPNGISANVKDLLVFSANDYIVFLNISNNFPDLLFKQKDLADLFVIDLSLDGKYLVTGMRNGQISLWEVRGSPNETPKEESMLAAILGSLISGLISIIGVIIAICKCCCINSGSVSSDDQKTKTEQKEKVNTRTEITVVECENTNTSIS